MTDRSARTPGILAVPVLLVGLLGAGLLGSCGSGASAAEPPPHVVVVVCDGLSADRLDLLGDWATEGRVYSRATIGSPDPAASTLSLLTGRHPSDGVTLDAAHRWPDDTPRLAEVLGRAGYATAAFSSHPLVSPLFGADVGFDTFVTCQPEDPDALLARTADVSAQVDYLLRSRPASDTASLFLYLHLVDLLAAPEQGARFRDELTGLREVLGALDDRRVVTVITSTAPPPGEARQAAEARVPLVVVGLPETAPGSDAEPVARASAGPPRVGLVDVLPTLAAVAGAPLVEEHDGHDLREAPRGRTFIVHGATDDSLAVLRDEYVAVRRAGRWQLLQADTGEDVSAYRADLLPDLQRAADGWRRRTATRGPTPVLEPARQLSARQRQQLAALGLLD